MNTLSKALLAVVLAPVAALVAGIGGCEARKAYYDWQVERMCEKDGGITVYEHIKISPSAASQMRRVGGNLAIAGEAFAKADDVAFLRGDRQVLREGHPAITRHEQAIVRRVDGKSLGRVVRYDRVGGDFPLTGSHPSQHSCPDFPEYYAHIAKVFLVE